MMRRCFVWVMAAGVLLAVHGASAAVLPARVGCAPSAEAAVKRALGEADGEGRVDGFRVVAVRADPLRKRLWAMVASCVDASRPMVAIELAEGAEVAGQRLASQERVRIGDRVAVMREGDDSRMELHGLAEDSGGAQDLIRVRLPKFSPEDAGAAPVIRCRVVGADVVEVVR